MMLGLGAITYPMMATCLQDQLTPTDDISMHAYL